MEPTPMLLPMARTDGRRKNLQSKAKRLRECLELRTSACINEFLIDNRLTTQAAYLYVIRSMLVRPMHLFKRAMRQLFTNTFNPWLVGVLNSNMDLQFILDEYTCAVYVVGEYVNKSALAMGNLHREFIKMMDQYPECDYTGQLEALGVKLLNAVERSAQKSNW
jgi:hypothetical protein